MRTNIVLSVLAALLISAVPSFVSAQASCALAFQLTPSTTCNLYNDDLTTATSSAPAPTCGGATAYGVWYKFTATSAKATITVSGLGTNLTAATTYVQILSGSCPTPTNVACQNVATPLAITTLSVGTTYFVRVFITSAPGGPAVKNKFSICIQSSLNDECVSSISLSPGT
ncbi:MAG: hypothetical protein M3Y85_06535, partial [Bacteroidota bacterium]|nr:hypothetical protein [Bacteroidota bacterium]